MSLAHTSAADPSTKLSAPISPQVTARVLNGHDSKWWADVIDVDTKQKYSNLICPSEISFHQAVPKSPAVTMSTDCKPLEKAVPATDDKTVECTGSRQLIQRTLTYTPTTHPLQCVTSPDRPRREL